MITIWHNPKCAKSREALALLSETKLEMEVVKYLEGTFSREEIKALLKKLGVSARELMRIKEDIYKELGLAKVEDEEMLIDALSNYPKLIERPILIQGNKAIIGRPLEKVIEFLKHT
jgi:arsenate reductase